MAEPIDSGETKREYFDMLAKLGVTKHVGSLDATNEILELCSLEPGMTVLDVGCGVGHTPKILAQWHGCRVIGIDLLPRMVVQARSVVRRAGVADQVVFASADAQVLPFADETFDLVMAESLNVFLDDPARAFAGYARVAKPGGCVGITEAVWLGGGSESPPANYLGITGATFQRPEVWAHHMEAVGLEDVTTRVHPADIKGEARGRIKRFGCGGMLGTMWGAIGAILRDPSIRGKLKWAMGQVPQDIQRNLGYGVYAGWKA
jgi:SAM-dependent methyltransferase